MSETSTTVSYRLNVVIASRNDFVINAASFQYSGGNTGSVNVSLTTYLDPSGDYTVGTGSSNITLNKSATLTKIAFQSCCKLSTLKNNSDKNWDIYTIVNTSAAGSTPVSSFPAVIDLPVGQSSGSYQVPASDPDAGTTLTYAFPSFAAGEWLAGQTEPPTFAINSSTGIATMNTVGLTVGALYNGIVTVTDNQGNQILIDFLIKIVSPSNPPAFNYPTTPAPGTVFNIM